jgi:hypothetical protein
MQTEAGHGGRRVFAGLMSEPVLDWLAILRFNRRKIALWSLDFFTHPIKLLLNNKEFSNGFTS